MEEIFEIISRTFFAFVVLLTMTRMLGKKQIGQMTFFTYITGIAMGNIAAEMVVNKDVTMLAGIIGLVLWTFFTFVMEWVSLKFAKARVVLDGEPTIVINKGVIQEKAMREMRLNMDDLTMLLRNNNAFSIQDVDYAIMEPNGKLSVLKKTLQENVTKGDMQIQAPSRLYMPTEIIVDGRIVVKNLREVGLTQAWLNDQLQSFGINNAEEVLLAELQSDGNLFVEKKLVEQGS